MIPSHFQSCQPDPGHVGVATAGLALWRSKLAPSPLFAVHQCQRPRVSCERIFDLLSGPLRGAAAIITAVLDTIWNTRFLFKKTPGELNHANKSLAKQYKTWTCSLHGPPSQDDVHAIADSKLRAYAEKVQKSREWPVNSTVEFIFAWKSLKDGKLVKTGLREIRPIMVHDEFTKQTWPVECIPENAMCDTYVEFGSLQRKWNLHHIAVLDVLRNKIYDCKEPGKLRVDELLYLRPDTPGAGDGLRRIYLIERPSRASTFRNIRLSILDVLSSAVLLDAAQLLVYAGIVFTCVRGLYRGGREWVDIVRKGELHNL